MESRSGWKTKREVVGSLIVFGLSVGLAWANVPLQVQDSAPLPGSALVQKSKEAREAAAPAGPSAPDGTVPGEEQVGPLEDIPSTATVFLMDPARPETIEAVEVGEGLQLTGRIRIGDAEIYIIEPEGDLPFELPVLSLAEARRNGLVEVREINPAEREALSGEYPSGGGGMVVAKNKGDVYVLFVGGEVLDGGGQDRMVASSAILPPKSGWVPLPVNCVEKGRSRGDSNRFNVADPLAHPVLRVHSLCEADQGAVWGEVDRVHRIERSSNPTHTYMDALDKGRDRAAIRSAADGIGGLLVRYPKAVGLVFVRDGAVQSIERMATPALFQAQKQSILESHLLGLATRAPVGVKPHTASDAAQTGATAEELQAFFASLRTADRLRAPLNHQGVGVVVRGTGLMGGETLTNLAPRDPALRSFAADLAKKGPAPNVLNQWAVRMN